MMAGNPNWWSMHSELRSSSTASANDHHQAVSPNLLFPQTHPSNSYLFPIHEHLHTPSSSSSSSSSSNSSSSSLAHDFPHSWSQLLLGGLGSEEERYGARVMESTRVSSKDVVGVKEEGRRQSNKSYNFYGYHHNIQEEEEEEEEEASWSHQAMAVSSPRSCVTTLSSHNNNNNNNNILDFSANNKTSLQLQSNNSSTRELPKKPKLQSSSTPPLKVRKEKLGDRITTLHQLVSPFGKTDTASVLLEAIGYIRFLQAQIQALSSPYLANNDNINIASTNNQHSVNGERNNCLFPDHTVQEKKDAARNLSSKGLCLVPMSCTHLVGTDCGAHYWAQSLGGGF